MLRRRSTADSGAAGSRVRLFLIALCVLVPIVPIVIGVLVLTSSKTQAAPSLVMRPLPVKPAAVAVAPHPVRRSGSTVALVTKPTALFTKPDGTELAPQPLKTTFGSPTVLLVRRVVGPWLGVITPLAGNGHLAWINRAAVSVATIDWTIRVSLARRVLTVYHASHLLATYRVAIGRPSAPTPTGLFAVTDRLQTGDPAGPYGCCILATSALAPHAIQDWGGGNRIAIHSTPPDTYWSIGEAVSHGCIHVTLPQGRWLLEHVPLGTPVIVRE